MEGRVKQIWKTRRKEERQMEGYSKGRAIKWNQKVLHIYTQYQTNKGRLGQW